ncbi:unnamed protein product [Orchesella dallaii]|uniref:Uncharacterized protein n=1 Tax=Orchesella dallaii TaxID=48710 RepID=A0ABP1QMQ8_9HEXA
MRSLIILHGSNVLIVLLAIVVNRSAVASSITNSLDTSSPPNNSPNNNNYLAETWLRNIDTNVLRLGARLDQLMIRLDHLDARVGRVQSQAHIRFDTLETGGQTVRQRIDLLSNGLNMIEEQMTRKWKTLESRYDSLVSSIDAKLDQKFNLIQRDNRRHNEFLSSSFNSVIISQEKLNERVLNHVNEINATITNSLIKNDTSVESSCAKATDLQALATKLSTVQATALPVSTPVSPYNHTSVQLITSKVNNMFEELVTSSKVVEKSLHDTFVMSNLTRREVQDGFRVFIPIANQISHNSNARGRSVSSAGSSGEVMSMVVEALASVESMSTALGRRMTELSRSIEERFEMVSMTLNGFLESCLRIQERAPLFEEHIAVILDRILDAVDNSTRNATSTWSKLENLLSSQTAVNLNASNCSNTLDHFLSFLHSQPNSNGSVPPLSTHPKTQEEDYDSGETRLPSLQHHHQHHHLRHQAHTLPPPPPPPDTNDNENTNEQVDHLSEEEKKSLWESWLATRTSSTVPE